jgi:hypothetical protein
MPRPPFTRKEYSTFSSGAARKIFRGAPGLQRAWGALHCHDADGKRFTLLGDFGWVKSLEAQAEPMTDEVMAEAEPPRGGAPPPSGLGVRWSPSLSSEWPIEEFKPAWVVFGWPDEWPANGIHLLPYSEVVPDEGAN